MRIPREHRPAIEVSSTLRSSSSALVVAIATASACREPAREAMPDAAPSVASSVRSSFPIARVNVDPIPEPLAPRLLALGASITRTYEEPRLAWRQVNGLSWQAIADALPPLPPEPEDFEPPCPLGMVLVTGSYALAPHGGDADEVLFLQNEACTRWRTDDRGLNGLCDAFDADRWRATVAGLPKREMRFCIDRYEYPNAYGEYPLVVATYDEGAAFCAREGKRLCDESEWTFACEGEEARPYPYGFERDPSICRTDVLAAAPEKDTFAPRTTEHTARGVDFAWQGLRSGEAARCASPFGVHDLVGNVDEWTTSVRHDGHPMILKGGHWGPGRHRCRPQTRGHGPHYVRYDQGFRCCSDVPLDRPADVPDAGAPARG